MKCIVCNSSFELSAEDNKKKFMHDPAYCSVACFIRHNDRKPAKEDMWNIHVGPVQKLPMPSGNKFTGIRRRQLRTTSGY